MTDGLFLHSSEWTINISNRLRSMPHPVPVKYVKKTTDNVKLSRVSQFTPAPCVSVELLLGFTTQRVKCQSFCYWLEIYWDNML